MGVKMIVVTTAAAIWDVATFTIGASDGSISAIAAGVATALPAVLESRRAGYSGTSYCPISQYVEDSPKKSSDNAQKDSRKSRFYNRGQI